MIPYLCVPRLWLDRIAVDAESILTVFGICVASLVAHRRARRLGIDSRRLSSFIVWLLVGALIGGHVTDLLCYRPDEIAELSQGAIYWHRPWELLFVWVGWRSVGGFLGAFIGAIIWRTHLFQVTDWLRFSRHAKIEGYWFVRREHPEPILPFADVTLSVFPLAWMFNRAGSALIHDHPGRRAAAESLFAVAFPDSSESLATGFRFVQGTVPRYDLGLLELVVTLLLAGAFVLLWSKPRRTGTYVCLAGLTYPPALFALDFLRRRTGSALDPVYGSLTPTQWGFGLLAMLSGVLLLWIWAHPLDDAHLA